MGGRVLLNAGLGPRPPGPSRAWQLLSAALGAGSVVAWWLPAAWLDWQPALAIDEPWRAWSAAWVHWSPLHLGSNLAGLAVLALLGRVAALPLPAALAWACAWPLTQAGLLLRPGLAHYGGLSGVLHAGVAVAALWLLLRPAPDGPAPLDRVPVVPAPGAIAVARLRSRVGAALCLGLLVKLALERPWGATLRHPADWDIAIAPLAHATGAVAGAVAGALAGAAVSALAALAGSLRARHAPPA